MTRFVASREGIGEILRSPGMVQLVTEVGYKALDHAREISPVYRGDYKAAWRMEVSEAGGPKGNRAEAQVVNDAGDRVLSDVVDGHDVPVLTLAYLEAAGRL